MKPKMVKAGEVVIKQVGGWVGQAGRQRWIMHAAVASEEGG